jgi:ribosome production factor 1
MSDSEDTDIPDNVNIINFDENDHDSGDENTDCIENEFARMKDFDDESDEDEPEEPEEAPEKHQPSVPLDQIAAGGVFSESTTDIKSSIASEYTGSKFSQSGTGFSGAPTQSHCGTSIIGDSTYTPKAFTALKFKVPETPVLTALKNKTRKRQLYAEFLKEKKKSEQAKSAARREKRMNETDADRAEKKAKFGKTTAQVDYSQKTIENMRVWDETTVPLAGSEKGTVSTNERAVDDVEVKLEQENDEFAEYFKGNLIPRVLITTSEGARNQTWKLALEMGSCIPNSYVLPRKRLAVKQIINQAKKRHFTSIIVINDDRGKPNGMLVSYLPEGPTAHFKLSNPRLRCEMVGKNMWRNGKAPRGCKGEGPEKMKPSTHQPELFLKRFGTRLGHRVGRLFASLYPRNPEFRGRQVVTLYNQRDFIFFRMHRYQFKKIDGEVTGKKVGLYEMGPRFTLKLRSLQMGTFDSKKGDYEWIHKRHKMDSSRRKFHL